MAANYDQPDYVEKRARFFDGQFLQDQDFVDEQKYHVDRQRRHNRMLHIAGVNDGLVVSGKALKVSLSAGTAVDSGGRQLLLANAKTIDIPQSMLTKTVELYIVYSKTPVDEQTQQAIKDYSRWSEQPRIETAVKGEGLKNPKYPPVLLAELTLDGSGITKVDGSVRQYSGLRLPGPNAPSPTLRCDKNGRVTLDGGLAVTGNVGIGTTDPKEALHVNGSVRGNQSGALRISTGTGYVDVGAQDATSVHFKTDLSQYYFDKGIKVDTGLIGSHDEDLSLQASGTTRMTISNSNGNVGIGYTTPDALLHVKGSTDPTIKIQSDGTDEISGRLALHEKNDTGADIYYDGTNTVEALRFDVLSSGTSATPSALCISNKTGTVGNVGIGTATPGAGLEVAGTSTASANNETLVGVKIAPTFNDGGKTGVQRCGLDIAGAGNTAGQVSLQLRSGNSNTGYDSNQITLGHDSTAEYRHAIKTRHNSGAASSNAIDFYVWKYLGASNKDDKETIGTLHTMTLDGGNVGIGTTSPAAKLEIIGAQATTNIETTEFMRLRRPTAPNVKHDNSAGFSVGTFESGLGGRARLDIKLSGTPGGTNQWGSIPDVTVMSLLANGNVGIGSTTIPNPGGWGRVVDILGPAHARLTIRSLKTNENVETTFYSHSGFSGGGVGGIGTDSNHPLNLFANATVGMTIAPAGDVKLKNGVWIDEFSDDATLSGNSDNVVPTEKAVKAYVDAAVAAHNHNHRHYYAGNPTTYAG